MLKPVFQVSVTNRSRRASPSCLSTCFQMETLQRCLMNKEWLCAALQSGVACKQMQHFRGLSQGTARWEVTSDYAKDVSPGLKPFSFSTSISLFFCLYLFLHNPPFHASLPVVHSEWFERIFLADTVTNKPLRVIFKSYLNVVFFSVKVLIRLFRIL